MKTEQLGHMGCKAVTATTETTENYFLKGIVWHFERFGYSLSCRTFYEKIDTTLVTVKYEITASNCLV